MSTETKKQIEQAINNFKTGNLYENSNNLLDALGYKSDKTLKLSPANSETFLSQFVKNPESFNQEKALLSQWKEVEFLFQLTKDEFNRQGVLFKGIDYKKYDSYLFFTIKLEKTEYSRTQLSNITREINKQFLMPAMILFNYGNKLTLAIIDRRINKRDEDKDVLKKVTLIKDINCEKPHRAHIEILHDLSFAELNKKSDIQSFEDLHKKWKDTLNLSELNKKFYTELSNWFFWMVDTCQLSESNDDKDNTVAGIRLVTRLIFNWFLKEKGLIDNKIFEKETYLNLLKNEYKTNNDLYYKVIIQNLFFGCLNKPILDRRFKRDEIYQGKNLDYNINDVYRYKKYFENPDDLITLFEKIPFLNGGLFECLDDKDDKKFMDFFTDVDSKNKLNIPDEIFFGEEKVVDISRFFENKASYKTTKIKGLFNILNHYKFTVDETTPVEEEIALDPELLGRVFENLLAMYNPETQNTARKATGSYYTPREIVNYMCEQSLINYFKNKLEDLNIEDIDKKLEHLLSYNEGHQFDENQVDRLISEIDTLKILDPACGSGAFPMGILHKLVHILSKIDQHNEKWKQAQIRIAEQIPDSGSRESSILAIENNFSKENYPDYSRKLNLIQKCIYGVDLQPIAVQISKLRFFISLIVDEKPNDNKRDNYGILSLPNLETRFVAANTLIDLEQDNLFSTYPKIVELRKKLENVRERYFNAKTRQTKKKLENEDSTLRELIKQEAVICNANLTTAAQLAAWDPFKPDIASPWFNSKWMFNVDGFDVIIGNPPYVFTRGADFSADFKNYVKKNYECGTGKINLFALFIEIAYKLCLNKGAYIYIIPNTFFRATTYKPVRKFIVENCQISEIVDLHDGIFESVTASTTIIEIIKSKKQDNQILIIDKLDTILNKTKDFRFIAQKTFKNDEHVFAIYLENSSINLIQKISTNSLKLKDICEDIIEGIVTPKGKDNFISTEKLQENYKKFLEGKNIDKFQIKWQGEYINFDRELLHRPRPEYLWKSPIKILIRRIGGGDNAIYATIDKNNYYTYASINNLLLKNNSKYKYEFILSLLNSKLLNWFYIENFTNRSCLTVNISKTYLEMLPIKNISKNTQNSFILLVNNILEITKIEDYLTNPEKQKAVKEYEKEIDKMVYKLYELTYDEVKIVDSEFRLSEKEYNDYKIPEVEISEEEETKAPKTLQDAAIQSTALFRQLNKE